MFIFKTYVLSYFTKAELVYYFKNKNSSPKKLPGVSLQSSIYFKISGFY
jgi:hypothetical protein